MFTGITAADPINVVALAHGVNCFRNAPEPVKAPGKHAPPIRDDTKTRLRLAEAAVFMHTNNKKGREIHE
jgi:hypothetical protein